MTLIDEVRASAFTIPTDRFAMANLWITDGSTLPTQSAANPALTIMALVARAAGVIGPYGRGEFVTGQ